MPNAPPQAPGMRAGTGHGGDGGGPEARRRMLSGTLGWLLLLASDLGARALFDPEHKIESARIYGNIDAFAYYYIDLIIGSPPQRVSVILDTGSGVAAFPCANCNHCGSHIDPAFDFAKSSSASWVSCGDGCAGTCTGGHCSYYQGYTEGSSISGYWFQDLVRLGDSLQHNPAVNARMGCHNNENNLFYTQKANGILGVGPSTRGNTLLKQLFQDHEHVEGSVFSICLAEWGGRLVVGGHNASYHTGPIQNVPLEVRSGYYQVHMTGLWMNGVELSGRMGTTMIDSGTTYTYMGAEPYNALRNAIESYCHAHNDCAASLSGKCWTVIDGLRRFPTVQTVFGNVRTDWVPKAYLYRRGGDNSNKWCYAFENDGPGANTVLGASWMLHQEIILDMRTNQVGIVPANCPEYRARPVHSGDTDVTPPTVGPPTTPAPPTEAIETTTTAASTTTEAPITTTKLPSTSTTEPPATTTRGMQTTTAEITTTTEMPTPTMATVTEMPTTTTVEATTSTIPTTTTPSATSALTTTTTTTQANRVVAQLAAPNLPSAQNGSDRWSAQGGDEGADDASEFDPTRLGVAVVVATVSLGACAVMTWRRCGTQKHKYTKQLDEISSGMPPQIVGTTTAGDDSPGADTFVIDDVEQWADEDGFEFGGQATGFDFGGEALESNKLMFPGGRSPATSPRDVLVGGLGGGSDPLRAAASFRAEVGAGAVVGTGGVFGAGSGAFGGGGSLVDGSAFRDVFGLDSPIASGAMPAPVFGGEFGSSGGGSLGSPGARGVDLMDNHPLD